MASSVCVEQFEVRAVPSATNPTAASTSVPSIDGSGHNLKNPDWGAAGAALLRISPADYADGIDDPSGASRPNAREISNAVATQTTTSLNDRDLSAFIYAWGQFIDHDIDLTLSASPTEAFNIDVPTGDPQFDPFGTSTQVIPLNRSNYDPATGKEAGNPRQQINSITAWIDGSMVYGSDETTAASLRTFEGGKLNAGEGNLLPTQDGSTMFQAGDIRANENPVLISLQTLFMREHNRIADELTKRNPRLGDEALYQQARLRVIGEIQAITYNEFLPALLGQNALRSYRGYNANVNPGIANEFSTAAFRVGHTIVGDDIEFLDDQGNEVRDGVSLAEAFFNADLVRETGIDPILKYLASDQAQEIDTQVIDSLRNFLFGPPGAGGLDLASLNIQRGRDHGLADYNTVREAYGLPRVTSFAQITSDVALQSQLESLYGDVDNIDLWVGGLAEDHVPGGSVGPTFSRIIADQFTRLRDGDRFWYQNVFRGRDLTGIRNTRLADVIRNNTQVRNLQDNVFFFTTEIRGRVFADANRNGALNGRERGVPGRTIELLDDNDEVIATAITDRNGNYRFDDVGLGTFKVREVLPSGFVNTTPVRSPIVISRGQIVSKIDFGEAPGLVPPVKNILS